MSNRNGHSVVCGAALCVLLGVFMVPQLLFAGEESTRNVAFGQKERGLANELKLYSPVPVHGPYPYLLYTARTGDVVQLQLSYPIAPPFPRRVGVTFDPHFVKPLDCVNTSGEVAVLEPGNPKEGVIGLGFYSLYIKGLRDGQTHLDVRIDFQDGDFEVVPFNFRFGMERKSARHGLPAAQ